MRDATHDATAAIDEQISTLREQQTVFDQQIQDMRLQQQLEDELHQSKLSQLEDELRATNTANDENRHSGENLVAYRRRLHKQELEEEIRKEKDKRALGLTELEIKKQKLGEETSVRVRALEDQKKALEKHLQDELKLEANQITALEAQKKVMEGHLQEQLRNETGAHIKALEDQKKALERHLQDVEAANRAGGAQMASDFGAAGAAGALEYDAAISDGLKGSFEAGQKWVDDYKAGFMTGAGPIGGAAYAIGGLIGRGIMRGVGAGFADSLDQFAGNLPWFAKLDAIALNMLAGAFRSAIPADSVSQPDHGDPGRAGKSFALGGITSEDDFVHIHANEAVLPLTNPSRSLSLMKQSGLYDLALANAGGHAGGGGTTLVQNYYGPVATEYVASALITRAAREARSRGLLHHSGRG